MKCLTALFLYGTLNICYCNVAPEVFLSGRKPTLSTFPRFHQSQLNVKRSSWEMISRGGDVVESPSDTVMNFNLILNIMLDAMKSLKVYMKGPKSDTLFLLSTCAFITPLCKNIGVSPILGFLGTGILFGPNGKSIIKDIHTTEILGDLGVVLFLFEMGIELSRKELMSMRKDVFGVGLGQFSLTAFAIALISKYMGLSLDAMIVLGGGLALSSSAFVLQLLKEKKQLKTRFGKSSFGILLLQDLMVVPLLVLIPILAGTGDSLIVALISSFSKTLIALTLIFSAGQFLLSPILHFVVNCMSQEAMITVILLIVLSFSFLTEGLGLSNTLGAFLAGVLLSENKYKHEIETQISPFRGILVNLFFLTVGFEIDIFLIASKFVTISSLVFGIIILKTVIATVVCMSFGLPISISQQVGLVLSQGGEFAFVSFRLARSFGILNNEQTKLLLTTVSITMALTPVLKALGERLAIKFDEKIKTK